MRWGCIPLIAEAEGHAHGMPVEEIHFHEVGTLDAVADVVGVCLLMEKIAPDRVVASPSMWAAARFSAPTASCQCPPLPPPISCGRCPSTAAASRRAVHPTGAALLKYFADSFRRHAGDGDRSHRLWHGDQGV